MKVVLGFSFGHRGTEPGISNEAMATVIQKLMPVPDIISVQWEIGKALKQLGITPQHEVLTHRRAGRYLDTEEVARQMLDFLHVSNLQNVIIAVLAHPAHLSRCIRILRKLGIRETVPINADIPYDPESHQIWTRSLLLLHIREILAFPIYLLRGYYTV